MGRLGIFTLLVIRIWQTWWDVTSQIMWYKDRGFHLGHSLSLALSQLIDPGESQLPRQQAALRRGLCGKRPRPAKIHVSDLGSRPLILCCACIWDHSSANSLTASSWQTLSQEPPANLHVIPSHRNCERINIWCFSATKVWGNLLCNNRYHKFNLSKTNLLSFSHAPNLPLLSWSSPSQ